MTTDFTVRPARPDDARRLAELRWAFKQEGHEGQPPVPVRPLEEAVTNFFVTPPRRNGGIGSALLEALELHARSAGFDTLVVWPSDRSSPLYRRSGFRSPEELLELPLDT
ncbi:hypothetical protein Snoj_37860 [Streptomyces nojiriensis]|uniref:N-acetyltransferase domain-containing protein n=1 Tax=Streptomyces nojiriensis TaxID=66374 RepID=A0ABQ3SP02_9ACTN|nr:GNAT family N-acetyltransferase [Streptomyces nojiriensis]QTI43416.1 hypothetical protein JYK04_01178 [Streptomyces nojiriensis]GGS12709.1 hypothetical protein GCM10010205_48230 [Streptomyces nojiriensis]GHI69868.1 hypothetical protein Snoj_37860 [Streptomyces nojiriensis]